MATYQPARRPRVRKTNPRPVRRTRRSTSSRLIPQLTLGGLAVTLFIGYILVKSYPLQAIPALIAIAAVVILAVIRPRRLAGLFHGADRIAAALPARSALPRQLTAEAFHRLSPGRFEHAVAELARDDDTMHATVVGGSGDGGADVLVKRKDGSNVLIQCKRYKKGNNVPSRDIRDANGAYWDLHGCHRAVIVTTADFTKDAKATNARLRQQVRLVNGADLAAWADGTGPSPLQ